MRWNVMGDLEVARISDRVFVFVETTDMDEACGRDNEGHPRWNVSVALVDLDAVGPQGIAEALRSCGWQGMPSEPAALAEVCHSYGHKAPIWDASGGNVRELHREGRRRARAMLDKDARAEAMERPVNRLGSTAGEYMRGDISSAMQRGCEAGDPNAGIVAKMYGVPAEAINDTRPEDWLPYMMGYLDALTGREANTDPDIAPEYTRGYLRGSRVRGGQATAPGWIQTR